MAPEGNSFLSTLVARRFVPLKRYTRGPTFGKNYEASDENPMADEYIAPEDKLVYSFKNTIAELCFEILERHSMGIHFREWNAGSNLDHAMDSKGFDISVGASWNDKTGFASGGNLFNCGTWMDKMGDSAKAKTLGVPATPRDGAPIEIVGLQKAFLNWIVVDLKNVSHWPWKSVEAIINEKSTRITFSEWNDWIQKSFEKCFFIPKGIFQFIDTLFRSFGGHAV
jgi:glycogen debranching enzyme